jgi:hypothetical protein
MGWQEELRRLDAELAAGRITHDRHRKLREELLASASGGAAPSPVASPLRRRAEQPWQSTNPGLPPAPAAAAITPPPKPVPPSFLTDRPTSAPSPADLRRTDSIPYPQQNNAPINRPAVPQPAVPPPLPPPIPANAARPETTRPMDDPFRAKSRNRPTWVFLAAGVLLVLALIIVGVWWVRPGTGNTQAATTAPSQPTTAPPMGSTTVPPSPQEPPAVLTPAEVAKLLPPLPGTPNKNNATMTIAKGTELNLYPSQAAAVFSKDGATEVIYRSTVDGPYIYFVLAFPTKTPQNAQDIANYLYQGAQSGGFTPTQGDVATVIGTKDNRRMTGSWYASGTTAMTVWASQPVESSETDLTQRLTQTLASLQKALPPL